ncbi:ribonuclease III [bacterium]|nr:ribonuclease III [FCB group bacterium]MBL7191546.1 ribonuclease III [bacterium]
MKIFSHLLQLFISVLKRKSGRLSDLRNLEGIIGYHFTDYRLGLTALKHRSALERGEDSAADSYERLEFLGDAVLGFLVTKYLYRRYPDQGEGGLSRKKSAIVSGRALAQRARDIGFGEFIELGEGEIRAGGKKRTSILGDVFEALIGAIYLDGGMKAASDFVQIFLLSHHEAMVNSEELRDYKSILQEYTQSCFATAPAYRVVNETGPDHKKIFSIEVMVEKDVMGGGAGGSKKSAEQEAAKAALKKLGVEE